MTDLSPSSRKGDPTFLLIAATAFLTLVDLFATQAIISSLAEEYAAPPAAVGAAVNACTIGMAVASLLVALFSDRIDRRTGILVSLVVLAVPTALLAVAPDLTVFTVLRIAQGLCMATAFSLTLTYLGERMTGAAAAAAFAAYVTGNVASNLVGRLISAGVAGAWGVSANFLVFAGLNLAGAALVYATIDRTPRMPRSTERGFHPFAALARHATDPALQSAFAMGFCILFAFVGVFTYVNFVLASPAIGLGMTGIGFAYFVFLPSVFTTPLAGILSVRFGLRGAAIASLALAGTGTGLLMAGSLSFVLAGMTLVAIGTFLAQAMATSFIGRAALTDRAAASGLYLACYFSGGLAGAIALGAAFDRWGWPGVVAGVAATLLAAGLFALRLKLPQPA